MTRRREPDLLGAMLESLGDLGTLGAIMETPTGRPAKVTQYLDGGRTVLLTYQDDEGGQVTLSPAIVKTLKWIGGEYA